MPIPATPVSGEALASLLNMIKYVSNNEARSQHKERLQQKLSNAAQTLLAKNSLLRDQNAGKTIGDVTGGVAKTIGSVTGGTSKTIGGVTGRIGKALGGATNTVTKTAPQSKSLSKPFPDKGNAIPKGNNQPKPYAPASSYSPAYPSGEKRSAVKPGAPKLFTPLVGGKEVNKKPMYPGTNTVVGEGKRPL